jgi:hypothetical protein
MPIRLRRFVVLAVAAAAFVPMFGGLSMPGGLALAAPEPDPIPRRWQLSLDVGPLRLMTVETPGCEPRAYFYLTYTVTNASGSDILLAPMFELVGGDAKIRRSGRDVPADVTRAILERLNNPFLLDQISIIGLILQGAENAKEGLVVWPADDLKPGDLTVYATGFSGEMRTIEVPDPVTGNPSTITLRKTMMVRYDAPGEIDRRGDRPLEVIEKRWILR